MANRIMISSMAAATWLAGCTGSNRQKDIIRETALPALQIDSSLHHVMNQKSVYTVNTSAPAVIQTSDGGVMKIPENAFTDMEGRPVRGNVDISYTPFQDMATIIASGIPMMASYGGTTGAFVSDGMFTVTASQQGKELKLKEGKSLEIFTPARDTVSEFKYWFFNTEKGAWEFTGERTAMTKGANLAPALQQLGAKQVAAEIATENEQPPAAPAGKPVAYDPSKPVLDIQLDINEYPELQEYNNIIWQYAGNDASTDPAANRWIYNSRWKSVEISPRKGEDLRYDLTILTGDKSFKTIVQPALRSKDYQAAIARYRNKLARAERQSRDSSLMKKITVDPSTLFNAFQVSKLGTYNCDRFYNDKNAMAFEPEISIDGVKQSPKVDIYFVMNDGSGAIHYIPEYYKLTVRPELVKTAVAVTAGGAIAVLGQSGLQELRNRKEKAGLGFKTERKRFRTMQDLAQFIKSL